MKGKERYQIEDEIEEVLAGLLKKENNVVVTTKCNLNCIFCSRKFNPFPIKYFHYDFNFIKAQISLLKPDRQILVNNSISRLTDGEPFTHPRIWDVLELIRKKFPYNLENKIRITTNGSYLTDSALKKLENLGGVIVAHSLKSMDIEESKKLTGASDEVAKTMQTLPKRIQNFSITYMPTVLVLPGIVGWEGVKKTICELNSAGIKRLTINMPAYTKYASEEEQNMLKCDQEKLYNLITELEKKLDMNMTVLPKRFEDLTINIHNFESAGILPEDEIIMIDNKKIFSRGHAQKMLTLSKKRAHIVKLKRKGVLKNKIIYSRDIKIETIENTWLNTDVDFLPGDVVKVVGGYGKVLVLASEAGSVVVRKAFDKALEWEPVLKEKSFFPKTVRSRFYGGSVICAGLLMCSDYRAAVKEFLSSESVKPDIILISNKSFDPLGRDLLKESVYDLSDEFNIPIETL